MQNENKNKRKKQSISSEELSQQIQTVLDAHKAIDIVTIDVRSFTDVFDVMIICTATSTRHGIAMADKLVDILRDQGIKPYGREGETVGEWVLIDYVDVVVHIMLPEIREFYALEKLWGNAIAANTLKEQESN